MSRPPIAYARYVSYTIRIYSPIFPGHIILSACKYSLLPRALLHGFRSRSLGPTPNHPASRASSFEYIFSTLCSIPCGTRTDRRRAARLSAHRPSNSCAENTSVYSSPSSENRSHCSFVAHDRCRRRPLMNSYSFAAERKESNYNGKRTPRPRDTLPF